MNLYVSTVGDDRWSGRLPEPSSDHSDGPFATVARARDEIRRQTPRDPTRVHIREGTYFLSEPLVFTAADSGTKTAPVMYAAFTGEKPVLSGGKRVQGWSKTRINDKEAWVTEAPDWTFRQLWINDGRRQRSRLPQDGFYRIPRKTECEWYEGTTDFFVRPGDMKVWQNLADVEMVLLASWVESRMPVVAVDEVNGTVKTGLRSALAPSDGSRYYVENVREALTQPGSWYCDRTEKKLYYIPYQGEDLEACIVIAPRLANLIVMEGMPDDGQFLEQVSFEGLTFAHTEWRRSDSTPIMRYDLSDIRTKKLIYMKSAVDDKASDHLAAVSVPGAVVGLGVRNCCFSNCTITHVGGYGIELGRGCQNNVIAACVFRDLGAGGVKLGTQTVVDASISFGNQIVDCDIGPGGLVFHGAVGIWVGQTANNLVAHNHIHNLFYTGISVGWSMGYDPSAAHNNRIEYNHIHDIGKGWLSDFGGIYLLGDAPGTVVHHNVVHDLSSGEYGACGLYYDEGTCQVVGENNLLYNIAGDAFFMHYGKNNILRNNILAFSVKGGLGSAVDVLEHGRIGDHIAVTIEHNIIYLREGEVYRSAGVYRSEEIFLSAWEPKRFNIRNNVIWEANDRPLLCAGRTWAEWLKQGADAGSRIGDPLFANPDRGDFSLPTHSPAVKAGFVPFDVSDVGPRVPVGAKATK